MHKAKGDFKQRRAVLPQGRRRGARRVDRLHLPGRHPLLPGPPGRVRGDLPQGDDLRRGLHVRGVSQPGRRPPRRGPPRRGGRVLHPRPRTRIPATSPRWTPSRTSAPPSPSSARRARPESPGGGPGRSQSPECGEQRTKSVKNRGPVSGDLTPSALRTPDFAIGLGGGPAGAAEGSSRVTITEHGTRGAGMVRFGILVALAALLGAGPRQAPSAGKAGGRTAPVLGRTFPLAGVGGPADRTGIPGRIDHMAYDPATGRLFIACVANGSLEVIDLERREAGRDGRRAPRPAGSRGRRRFRLCHDRRRRQAPPVRHPHPGGREVGGGRRRRRQRPGRPRRQALGELRRRGARRPGLLRRGHAGARPEARPAADAGGLPAPPDRRGDLRQPPGRQAVGERRLRGRPETPRRRTPLGAEILRPGGQLPDDAGRGERPGLRRHEEAAPPHQPGRPRRLGPRRGPLPAGIG